jgi:O-succinylbenzoate synthase
MITLQDPEGQISYGEIAPLPGFGSETLDQAFAFCSQYSQGITATEIMQIPEQLPACQFAFESALESFFPQETPQQALSLSVLLPAGESVLQAWQSAWQQGQQTFKWKIGVFSLEEELAWFEQLVNALPEEVQLRLDANGGLTLQETQQWLHKADLSGKVEFIEQPLPPHQFEQMQELAATFTTPIALDESVGTLRQLQTCYNRGWRGIFVLKCAIAGSPRLLRELCHQYPLDLVFSSVMETTVAREAVFRLARELNPKRALGFGIEGWFHQ